MMSSCTLPRTLSAMLVVCLLGSACADSTSPDSAANASATVNLKVDSVQGPSFFEVDGYEELHCNVFLSATATARDAKWESTWEPMSVRFYWGADRTIARDSMTFDATSVGNTWGDDAIAGNETQQSEWEFWAGLPFEVELVATYRPALAAPSKEVRTRFACGPKLPANAPPPTLADLSLTPATGDVEPGDTLHLRFTANAAAGLLRTSWRMNGACNAEGAFPEKLPTTASHDVALVIPATCPLGAPITIDIGAFDAALLGSAVRLSPSLRVIDETPPTIAPRFFDPFGYRPLSATLRGSYFAGQSFQVLTTAGDNSSIRSVQWEVLPFGHRDSSVAPLAANEVFIPTQVDWSGKIQIRLWAEDQAGNKSAVFTTEPDSVTLGTSVERPSRVTTVPGLIETVAFDSKRQLVYLGTVNGATVQVLSLATMSLGTPVALPRSPTDVEITPGGDSLLVTTYGDPSITVVDLRQTPFTTSSLPVPSGDAAVTFVPQAVSALANGHALVPVRRSATGTDLSPTLADVDLATGAVRLRTDMSPGAWTVTVARSLDRRVAFVNGSCLQRYDVTTDGFTGCTPTLPVGARPTVDASGAHLAVSMDVYDGTLTSKQRVSSIFPDGLVPSATISPDGAMLNQLAMNVGIIRSPSDGTGALERYVGSGKGDMIAVSPDSRYILTVEKNFANNTSSVTVISLP